MPSPPLLTAAGAVRARAAGGGREHRQRLLDAACRVAPSGTAVDATVATVVGLVASRLFDVGDGHRAGRRRRHCH